MRTHFRNIRGGRASSPSGADAGQGALGFFRRYSGGGRSPQKSPCASPRISEQGSALLIVLGFLSFMMISAVSFAVYMRIERQASSNYRHATAARHLLTAGLFRAIDEIDAELRVPEIKGMVRPRKFPDWQGRVRASAVPNGEKNTLDARVLSMEALSFIPGLLVNDVRRYAIPNQDDQRDSLNTTWCGAKWRTISMPGNVMGSDGDLVTAGRYAYVCINVSDMLDVNVCRAASRDSVSNRVSIGHLFANDGARDAFDASFKTTDKHYDSLQDFYACMYKRDTTFGSPFHEYLNAGNSVNADAGFDEADNHILVTDGIVKPEPTRIATPCNILAKTGQPIDAATLNQPRATSIALQGEFQTALGNALAGRLVSGATAGDDMMATMIADYIDADSIPKKLNMPSTEMVPMISQILIPEFMSPTIKKVPGKPVAGAAPPRDSEIYAIQLVSDPTVMQLDVELVWPFKNQKDRTRQPAFRVDVQAYLKVIKIHDPKKTQGFVEPPSMPTYVPLTGSANIPSFWSKDTSDPVNCYVHVPVELSTPDPTKLVVNMIDSEDGVVAGSGFTEGQKFSVALVVFVNVKEGSDIVDRAPQLIPFLGAGGMTWEEEFMLTPKLFFQTVASAPVAKTMVVGQPIQYEWRSLEVPDPRFNYKAENWVQNFVDPPTSQIKPLINPSTTALLGQDGRDGDIYMSVSDVGVLQSPGELGFIVRPFPQKLANKNADFRQQLSVNDSEDKDAMFRTIRLYDHGDPSDLINRARDRVYDHFTVRNPDGTLAGARVNPLSELPQVLAAAVQSTPADYYWAGAKLLPSGSPSSATIRKNVFDNSTVMNPSSWTAFTNGWFKCLVNATKLAPPAQNINTSLKNNLSDLYGEQAWFGWYSNLDPTTIFDGGYTPGKVSGLSSPLHEIDRKMLFSFTLDSFSDRQQLFLYILRAEATVPNFGGSTDGGVKSLAGGRAVALVWRDPYPEGYNKGNDSWLNKGSRMWTQSDHAESGSAALVSPWYQYNILSDKPSKDDGDEDGTFDPRLDGYHQQRILYFKQLNN